MHRTFVPIRAMMLIVTGPTNRLHGTRAARGVVWAGFALAVLVLADCLRAGVRTPAIGIVSPVLDQSAAAFIVPFACLLVRLPLSARRLAGVRLRFCGVATIASL